MNRYFLVDYVRTGEMMFNSLDGIERLTADDTVLLLLEDESQSISFQEMKKIMASPAEFNQKLLPEGGELAIECALSFLIGRISGQNAGEIFVISSDGYCCDFLNKFESPHVASYPTIADAVENHVDVSEIRNLTTPDKKQPQTAAPNLSDLVNDEHAIFAVPHGWPPKKKEVSSEFDWDELIAENNPAERKRRRP